MPTASYTVNAKLPGVCHSARECQVPLRAEANSALMVRAVSRASSSGQLGTCSPRTKRENRSACSWYWFIGGNSWVPVGYAPAGGVADLDPQGVGRPWANGNVSRIQPLVPSAVNC